MSRDSKVYLEDIIGAVGRIRKYLEGRPWKEASKDEKTFDAVVRNIEVIGEAVKHLPIEMTTAEKSVEWRKIAGMRDVLAHEYFGVDEAIIGDVVEKKLEGLDRTARRLLSDKDPSVREKDAPYAVNKTLKKVKKKAKTRR
jgi:uncharacterized protein with HEPN domain